MPSYLRRVNILILRITLNVLNEFLKLLQSISNNLINNQFSGVLSHVDIILGGRKSRWCGNSQATVQLGSSRYVADRNFFDPGENGRPKSQSLQIQLAIRRWWQSSSVHWQIIAEVLNSDKYMQAIKDYRTNNCQVNDQKKMKLTVAFCYQSQTQLTEITQALTYENFQI